MFQLLPEHRLIQGFDKDNFDRAVMITHKRSFDVPPGEEFDPNDLDQCTLTIEQRQGLIHDIHGEEKSTKFDWFYEILYKEFDS